MGTTGTSTSTPAGDAQPPMIQRKTKSRVPLIAGIVVVIIIVAALGGGYAAGWFKTASSKCGTTTKGTLLAEGSTLVAPLMDQWASTYWGGGVLTYDSVGSSSGISAITTHVADIGASDAPLTASQRSSAPGLLTIPESAGGVVPIYNLAGITSLNFNGSVLAEIFDGSITNWNNTPLQTLNPHTTLPSATIDPIYRTGGSGTTFIFTSFLTLENAYWAKTYGKGLDWPTNITVGSGASGNGGVATTVGTTPDAIGYVDLNYALTAGSAVGIGSVENPAGNFIRATVANTLSALEDAHPTLPAPTASWYNVSLLNAPGTEDYPITSFTYMLVYENLSGYSGTSNPYTMTKAENLVDFLTWAVTVGQNYSAILAYVPLPSYVTDADLSAISLMNLGGSSIPVCVPSS